MAKTDPDAPRHRQFTTFLVELPNPGYEIVRNIPVMGEDDQPDFPGEVTMGHAEVRIQDLAVPDENILGGLGAGLRDGPASARLRAAAPRHVECRQGAGGAGHGDRASL